MTFQWVVSVSKGLPAECRRLRLIMTTSGLNKAAGVRTPQIGHEDRAIRATLMTAGATMAVEVVVGPQRGHCSNIGVATADECQSYRFLTSHRYSCSVVNAIRLQLGEKDTGTCW